MNSNFVLTHFFQQVVRTIAIYFQAASILKLLQNYLNQMILRLGSFNK